MARTLVYVSDALACRRRQLAKQSDDTTLHVREETIHNLKLAGIFFSLSNRFGQSPQCPYQE